MTCDVCGWGGSMDELKIVKVNDGLGISFYCDNCGRFKVFSAKECLEDHYITERPLISEKTVYRLGKNGEHLDVPGPRLE